MTAQEIIESIKFLIKGHAEEENSVTLNFFEEKKEQVLNVLTLVKPALKSLDGKSANEYYQVAVKEYISVYPVDIDPSSSLKKKGFKHG